MPKRAAPAPVAADRYTTRWDDLRLCALDLLAEAVDPQRQRLSQVAILARRLVTVLLGAGVRLDVRPTTASSRYRLTPQDRTILIGISHGRTDTDIARHLDITEEAVNDRVANLLKRLGAGDRTTLACMALRLQLID